MADVSKKEFIKQIRKMNEEDFNVMLSLMDDKVEKEEATDGKTDKGVEPKVDEPKQETNPKEEKTGLDELVKELLERNKKLEEKVEILAKDKPFGITSKAKQDAGSEDKSHLFDLDAILAKLNNK